MTILPKKKVEQKEEGEREASDHQHPHGGASHAHRLSGGAEARGARPRGPVAPPGEPEPLDCGPSHSKRRHRASPHRSCRKSHRASHGAGATAAAASPRSDEAGGYNSDDEHDRDAHDRDEHDRAPEPLSPEPGFCEQGERRFEKVMKEKKGFIIKRMSEDGACLFRAAADQVYGDQDMHDVVRKHCMDYLMKNSDYFSNYVTEDFATYVNRKSMNHCHGNHIEMQAMAEMYNRTFEVYQYSTDPINTFHSIYKSDNEPIRVSYHQNAHYNSVVNPNKATIGVGLGLPSFKPGNADKTLMQSAITTSEESWIEQQMLEDKKRATDWEATNEAIEEQVARESYLQWLRDQEKNDRRPRKVTATCSSATAAAATGIDELGGRSPRQRSTLCSSPEHQETSTESLKPASPGFSKPPSPAAGTSTHPCSPQPSSSQAHSSKDSASMAFSSPLLDCRTVMQQMSPTAFGLTDWEDDDILASVIAASQQEYLDSLKKKNSGTHRDSPPPDAY